MFHGESDYSTAIILSFSFAMLGFCAFFCVVDRSYSPALFDRLRDVFVDYHLLSDPSPHLASARTQFENSLCHEDKFCHSFDRAPELLWEIRWSCLFSPLVIVVRSSEFQTAPP